MRTLLFPGIRSFDMIQVQRAFCMVLLAFTLAACGTKEVKRINPPDASVQSLVVTADTARVTVRVHNHSDLAMQFGNFDLSLRLGTNAPIKLTTSETVDITPHTGELIELSLDRARLPADAIARLDRGEMVAYSLFGGTESFLPKQRKYDLSFEARLSAVPGKPGEYR